MDGEEYWFAVDGPDGFFAGFIKAVDKKSARKKLPKGYKLFGDGFVDKRIHNL